MSYRSDTATIKTVPLGEGKYSATVRKLRKEEGALARAALLGSDRQRQVIVTDITTGEAQGTAEQTIDPNAYTNALLTYGIVSWNLTGDPPDPATGFAGDDMDENGILRLTQRNFAVLTEEDVQSLTTAINGLSARPGDEEKNT